MWQSKNVSAIKNKFSFNLQGQYTLIIKNVKKSVFITVLCYMHNLKQVQAQPLYKICSRITKQRKLLFWHNVSGGCTCTCFKLCTYSTYQWWKYKRKNSIILELNKKQNMFEVTKYFWFMILNMFFQSAW